MFRRQQDCQWWASPQPAGRWLWFFSMLLLMMRLVLLLMMLMLMLMTMFLLMMHVDSDELCKELLLYGCAE